jgi:Asp-tRNA(Asn)/Glu-tRNA(Gln) amidotransferase A subunit family amidase
MDNAMVLSAVAGLDPLDRPPSLIRPGLYPVRRSRRPEGTESRPADEFFGEGIEKSTRDAVLKAAETLGEHGAESANAACPGRIRPARYYIISSQGLFEPRAVRRVKYGHTAKGAESVSDIYILSRWKVSEGSQAPHHARHFRPFLRLLRRYYKRARSQNADHAGLCRGL